MPTRDEVKRSVCDAIDRRASQIVSLGETIRKSPELGFKEFNTARIVEETLAGLGLAPKTGLAITGVKAEARGAKDGPTFALLGELDGLVVAGHPIADPQTGAAHACGHNAQIAGMLGAAMGLTDAKAISPSPARSCSSRCPRRSTGTWRGASSRRGAGGSSSSAASPSCSASGTSTTWTSR